jgi:hypothetical protein
LLVLTQSQISLAQVPPPPTDLAGIPSPAWTPTWTLGGFYLNTEDPAGPLNGGGASLEFMLSPHLGVEVSLVALGGLVEEEGVSLRRGGLRTGGAVIIYPLGLRGQGVNPYLRGGFLKQRMTYTIEMDGSAPLDLENRSSFSEVAAGLRLMFGHRGDHFALSVSLEAAALFADEQQDGDVTVEHDEPSIVFRAGVGFHF